MYECRNCGELVSAVCQRHGFCSWCCASEGCELIPETEYKGLPVKADGELKC